MANAKKIIRIVGIILLVIGLFIIILFSIYKIRYSYIDLIQIIPGVFLFVIGLVFLMASRKMIYREKKIVKRRRPKGIVLLVIGSICIVFFGSYMYVVGLSTPGWAMVFITPTIVGVLIFVIGLIRLLASRKKYSKSLDKSVT